TWLLLLVGPSEARSRSEANAGRRKRMRGRAFVRDRRGFRALAESPDKGEFLGAEAACRGAAPPLYSASRPGDGQIHSEEPGPPRAKEPPSGVPTGFARKEATSWLKLSVLTSGPPTAASQ